MSPKQENKLETKVVIPAAREPSNLDGESFPGGGRNTFLGPKGSADALTPIPDKRTLTPDELRALAWDAGYLAQLLDKHKDLTRA